MRRFLARFLGLDATPARQLRPTRRMLQVETLQERLVPTVIGTFPTGLVFTSVPTVSVINGDLYIYGTGANDTVRLEYEGSGVKVTANGQIQRFTISNDRTVYFWGYDGADNFRNLTGLKTNADGGNGNDAITGGYNIDILGGSAGNDTIDGAAGEDYLFGGTDHDVLFAGYDANYNYLNGEDGNDILNGGNGFDYLVGHNGIDWINGGNGNDLIYAGEGGDTVHGDGGHDSILGQGGSDSIHGDAGNDFVDGGNDSDSVYGGADDDVCFGGVGSDRVDGGSGADRVCGGETILFNETTGIGLFLISDGDNDMLIGGTGHDYFYIGDDRFLRPRDDAVDYSSEDSATVLHVYDGAQFYEPFPDARWGHLYGT